MSEKVVELVRLAERGDRIAQVRDAARMSGDEFADAINRESQKHGYTAGFDKTKVSRLEQGKMTFLPAEVAVVVAQLDPQERGIGWLVFGDQRGRGIKIPPGSPSRAPSSRDADVRKAK